MTTAACKLVQGWVRQAAQSADLALSEELHAHIAGCPTCKGALLLMLTELLAIRPDVEAADCQACEPLLAAYLELELEVGSAAALRAYPLVAWHLWTCPDCAELARLTGAALRAARSGALPPPAPLAQPPQTLLPRVQILIRRAALAPALPRPNPILGAARGPDSGPEVLYEREVEDRLVTLTATHDDDGSWRLSLAVDPPEAGRFRLTIGNFSRETRLADGLAVVTMIPPSVLEDDDGPDLHGEVTFEPAPA